MCVEPVASLPSGAEPGFGHWGPASGQTQGLAPSGLAQGPLRPGRVRARQASGLVFVRAPGARPGPAPARPAASASAPHTPVSSGIGAGGHFSVPLRPARGYFWNASALPAARERGPQGAVAGPGRARARRPRRPSCPVPARCTGRSRTPRPRPTGAGGPGVPGLAPEGLRCLI